MRRLFFYYLWALFCLLFITACKCSSEASSPKERIEPIIEERVKLSQENNTIGVWVTKIARDDSIMTLYYSKSEKQFFVRDELKNTQGTYYNKMSPVSVTLQPDGRYFITYQNGMKDCYYLDSESGLLDWRCEGYDPETVKPKSYNAQLYKLALEDIE